jgi:hypothetical protein
MFGVGTLAQIGYLTPFSRLMMIACNASGSDGDLKDDEVLGLGHHPKGHDQRRRGRRKML